MKIGPQSIQKARLSIMALLVGILAAYGAVVFRGMIALIQNLFFDQSISFSLLDHIARPHMFYECVLPIFGLLASNFLIEKYASEARGHGVPEVIEAVQHRSGIIRKRVAFVKSLASSFTIGSGGSLGREGPIVQIGAAIGSYVGQILNLSRKEIRILVGCGASAGIAATFNTPIAGVIFSVELILLEWRAKSFIPLVVATVFATLISRSHLGDQPAFLITEFALRTNIEIVFYLVLGIITALVAFGFIRGIDQIETEFKKLVPSSWMRCIVAGGLIGILGYIYPYLLGGGYETTDAILHESVALSILLPLLIFKVVAVGLTLAGGGSGGVFAPSLLMGAITGGIYGYVVHWLFPEYTMSYGAYALVGMGCFFAAASRGTFTSIVILFEMTRNYSIILPLMFACVIADQIALLLLGQDSIYATILRRKKLNFSTDFGIDQFAVEPIKNFMIESVESIRSGTTIKEAWEQAQEAHHTVYPVLNENHIVLGTVSYFDLEFAQKKKDPEAKVEDIMRGTPCAVYPHESAQSVIVKLERSRDPRAFIIDPNTKKLLGIVTPTDLIRSKGID